MPNCLRECFKFRESRIDEDIMFAVCLAILASNKAKNSKDESGDVPEKKVAVGNISLDCFRRHFRVTSA